MVRERRRVYRIQHRRKPAFTSSQQCVHDYFEIIKTNKNRRKDNSKLIGPTQCTPVSGEWALEPPWPQNAYWIVLHPTPKCSKRSQKKRNVPKTAQDNQRYLIDIQKILILISTRWNWQLEKMFLDSYPEKDPMIDFDKHEVQLAIRTEFPALPLGKRLILINNR